VKSIRQEHVKEKRRKELFITVTCMAMLTSFEYGNNRPNVLIGTKVRFLLEFVHFLYIDYYFQGYIYVVKA
jgi:hypothetical protein